MDFKYLAIFLLSIVTIASCQSISCVYTVHNGDYNCNLSIDNPNGFDGFSEISGTHLIGRTNADVRSVRLVSGTTTIIPRVLCDLFSSLAFIDAVWMLGLQSLTENAFNNCLGLIAFFVFSNPQITQIHPDFLRTNVNLNAVELHQLRVTSLPEELFSATNMTWIEITLNPSLTDLPVNLFRTTPFMRELDLSDNGLTIWRPEWTQSMTQLSIFSINGNSLATIPRNALNTNSLSEIFIAKNQLQVLDYFMFNDISNARRFWMNDNPIEAIDFNLLDRATNLALLDCENLQCINRYFGNFYGNREANMMELEPCFAAFDKRRLGRKKSWIFVNFN